MNLALVTLQEAGDLFGAVGITLFGAFLWSRMRRKDKLRRVAAKERQAEYSLRLLRAAREREAALRYFGRPAR